MTLPKGWTKAKVGEFTLERVEQGEPGVSPVPYIDIGSIDRDLKRVGPTEKVTGANAPTRARQWVKPGDVLVSLTRPNLNAVAVVSPELDGAVVSTGFDVLRPDGVLPEWVFNRVRSQAFVSDVCEDVQGVVYPAIRPADVRRHELPIPPAQEQRRIVEAVDSYLTRLDDAVASLERVQAKLKAYRASVLKAAVEGRLVLTEASLARAEKRAYEPAEVLLARVLNERSRRWEEAEPAKLKAAGKTPKDDKWKAQYHEPLAPNTEGFWELPEGWCWASPAQLATPDSHAMKAGPFGSALKKDSYTASGYKIYGQEQVIRGDHAFGDYYIDEAKYESLSTCAVRPGDVLVSLVGTIGRLLVLPSDAQPGIINPRLIKLSLDPRLIDPNFFRVFFCSPSAQAQLHRESQGATMSILNLAILKRLAVPLPPRTEQERIVLQADRLDSIGSELGVQAQYGVARTRRLRQSILKWAFEGKLVEQDPSDEPADKLLVRIRAARSAVSPAKKTPGRRARGVA